MSSAEEGNIEAGGIDEAAERSAIAQPDARTWSRSSSVLFTVGVSAIVAAVVAASGLFLAERLRGGRMAVLDLAEVVEIEQTRLTLTMLKPGVTDDDRLKAYQQVKGFGEQLSKAIEDIKASCRCILLTRNAYIGAADVDYTPLLKTKLGLESLDLAMMRQMVSERTVTSIPTPQALNLATGKKDGK